MLDKFFGALRQIAGMPDYKAYVTHLRQCSSTKTSSAPAMMAGPPAAADSELPLIRSRIWRSPARPGAAPASW